MTVLKMSGRRIPRRRMGHVADPLPADDHDVDPDRARRVPAPRRHRQGKAGGSSPLADLRRQHPGRDQGLLGQLDAADPHRSGGPDARQPLGRGDHARPWKRPVSASCRSSRSGPATWRCSATWRPSRACSGTITGLIKSFAGVAGVDPSQKATLLSKGISEAMNCTAFGLFTGIIGLAAFACLNGKTQNALDDIAEVKKNVSNLLYQAKAAMHG